MMNRSWQTLSVRLARMIAALLLAACPAVAQQSQQTTNAQSQDQSKSDQAKPDPSKPDQSKPDQSKPGQSNPEDKKANDSKEVVSPESAHSNDRLFYALPNFLTVENADQLPPLTTGQKFKLQARSQFDLVEFPWYGFLAAISQATNSEPGYGQGADGYAKRYGAAWGDGGIENFMTGAIFPSLLHQDPRYFQLGKGSFWHRTRYAVGRIFITRSDSGNKEFNYSEIFGSALAAGISTYTYHPHADKTLANTGSVWGTQLALDAMTFEVKEFWPDIKRMISRKRQGEVAAP
jgi:hypothetical protein